MNSVEEKANPVWDNANLYVSTTDCTKDEILTFQGKVPEWLNGTLYRNGPGANEINNDPSTKVYHAFDGFAYIQKYQIDGSNQTVNFRGSFIKSRTYNESLKTGRLASRQFGTDPCKSIFGRFQSLFFGRDPSTFTDDTGVTIQMINNELIALTETVLGNILDANTLELLGPLTGLPYAKSVPGEIMSTTAAHVMYDEKRKMTIGYSGRISKVKHWLDVIFIPDEARNDEQEKENNDDDEDVDKWLTGNGRFLHMTQNKMTERAKDFNRRIRSLTKHYRFPYDYVSYMHSGSISEDYLILTEIPFHFNTFYAIWNSLAGGAVTDMFKWNGDTMPTYFRVISLDSGEEVARIPGPAFFTFHHINSYQTKDNPRKIIVDVCAFDNAQLIHELYLNDLRQNQFPSGTGYLRRFELDLDAKTCSEPNSNAREPQGSYPLSYAHSLIPVQFELPRINPKYIGKPYRYVYVNRGQPGRLFDVLLKLDVESKEQVAIWEQPCTSPSEPVFVPNPNGSREDDGVVLSVILDQRAKKSFLVVLDGMTFKELARANLPIHIPLSFHGNFY